MRTTPAAWLVPLLLLGTVGAEEPVHFGSAKIKAEVEKELGIPDPTPTDMLDLISLYVGDELVSDVTGLEYAVNLQTLRLPCNWLHDMTFVASMPNLEVLVLNNNSIGDLSPLSGLANLRHLDMHDNHAISDLRPLAGLTNLETLILRGNRISDVSPLSGLANLQSLRLEVNQISDISPLLRLTTLTFLDLQNNPLAEEAYTVYIPQILVNNPGVDVRPSVNTRVLSISATAGGSVIDPGEGRFEYRLEWYIRLEARAEPGFLFAGWTGTFSTDQNPVYIALNGDHQIRANFVSAANTLWVDDDAPADPGPCDPTCGDPEEEGTAEHPFDSIQQAIEVAAQGARILVQPGTYRENLDLLGKSLDLTAMDPAAPGGGPCAVLEGTGGGPLVRFSGTDTQGSLRGFVLTRGQGQPAAALFCDRASPTITHCLFVGNRTADPNGAVIYCRDSRAILANCTIADNYGGAQGAALVLWDSDVTVTNSIFWGNRPREILELGTSAPDIRYCAVPGWCADVGNIDADPLFAQRGGWVNPDNPREVLDATDVRGIWMAGDYHLQSTAGRWQAQTRNWVQDSTSSPCLDGGDPASPIGEEPAPHGGIINLGAYGGTSEASKSP